jgi:hypothetical protein
MKMLNLFAIAFSLILTHAAHADINQGDVRLGLTGGHVGLLSDVGDRHGNALGFGGYANYTITSEMQFELGYLTSSHNNNYKRSEISAGVNIFFNSYDAAYFAALMGVDFVGADIGDPIRATSSGMALYGGLGVDFELNKHFSAGLYAKYHYAFETSVNNAATAGSTVKAIQSWMSVLVRIAYIIPNS